MLFYEETRSQSECERVSRFLLLVVLTAFTLRYYTHLNSQKLSI